MVGLLQCLLGLLEGLLGDSPQSLIGLLEVAPVDLLDLLDLFAPARSLLLGLLDGLCDLLLEGTPALLAPALLLFDALDRFLLEATPAPLHLLRKLLPEFLQSPPTFAVCLLELLNTAPSLASVLLGGLLDLLPEFTPT